MDTLLLSGVDDRQREILDRNPEAIFDILTMNTRKGRHSNAAFTAHVFQDGLRQNEAEFEAFVQQFPIDDSISECFALASETESKSPLPKFVTGAKRPQVSKYSKLKKKLGWGTSEENLNMADESMSRETKRSKKGGGVESKRHKWRTPKEKSVNFADSSEFDTVGEFPVSVDVHVPQSRERDYTNMAPVGSVSVSGSSGKSYNSIISAHVTGSDDVFDPSSSGYDVTVYEGPRTPRVPPKSYIGRVPDYVNVGSVRKDDCFSSIMVQDPVIMMKNLEELLADLAMETRDERGNTLLHRCVELGNPDAVYMLLDRFPGLSSDMNSDNMTAIELAVKLDQVSCLKVMLERNHRHKALGTPLLNRLLNISGTHGQHECLKVLLSYLPRDQHSNNCLPGDARGNTAAHISAKTGHIQCLQTLVSSGYDVTSENLIHQRPLQVAHQNNRHVCFGYLMLLDICEKLLSNIVMQASVNTSLRQQTSGIKSSIAQLKSYLDRYQKLIAEARESLVENRESILESLVTIHEDLIQVTENSGNESGDKQNETRDKLDELAGEIERLEDTFEFSPLEDIDVILSRVAQSLDESLVDGSASSETRDTISISEDQLKNSLCKLLRDVHEDAMAENWNTNQKVGQTVNELVKENSNLKSNPSIYVKQNVDVNELRLSLDRLNSSNSSVSQTSRHSEGKIRETQKSHSVQNVKECSDTHQEAIESQHETDKDSRLENASRPSENTNNLTAKPSWANLRAPQKHQPKTVNSVSAGDTSFRDSQKLQNQTIHKNTTSNRTLPGKVEDIASGSRDNPIASNNTTGKDQQGIRQLSLDERMDLLIAGERAREKLEDAELSYTDNIRFVKPDDSFNKQTKISPLSPKGTDSICTTTTFTSITSDSSEFSSDFQTELERQRKRTGKSTYNNSSSTEGASGGNLVPKTMIDSTDSVTSIDMFTLTSDSTSYWWDVEDENDDIAPSNRSHMHSDRLKPLEEESVSNEELRRQRVIQHIKALQRTRFPSNEFAEKITTASGETMGGFETTTKHRGDTVFDKNEKAEKRIVVDVHSALKARQGFKPIPVPRSSKRTQVSDSEDSGDAQSITENVIHRHFGAGDQDVSSLDVRWEDMYMSEDDVIVNGKPWYEMSSDDDVSLVPSWRSDDDTEGSRTPRMI